MIGGVIIVFGVGMGIKLYQDFKKKRVPLEASLLDGSAMKFWKLEWKSLCQRFKTSFFLTYQSRILEFTISVLKFLSNYNSFDESSELR